MYYLILIRKTKKHICKRKINTKCEIVELKVITEKREKYKKHLREQN